MMENDNLARLEIAVGIVRRLQLVMDRAVIALEDHEDPQAVAEDLREALTNAVASAREGTTTNGRR